VIIIKNGGKNNGGKIVKTVKEVFGFPKEPFMESS